MSMETGLLTLLWARGAMTTTAKLAVVLGCSPDLMVAFSTTSMVIQLATVLATSMVIQLATVLASQLAVRAMSTAMGLLI